MGLKWLSASKSMLAFLMMPPQHPTLKTPQLVGRLERRIRIRVHTRTLQMWILSEQDRLRCLKREIKTHNGPQLKWPKVYPQLYLSQTPHIHHAFHKNSTFTFVQKFTVGQSELANVDKTAQAGFKKLRKLLGYIKSLVLKHGAMRISLVCVDKTLSVYRMPQGESCLPGDALALFIA